MMTDPIADMLTRVRNANAIRSKSVSMPASRVRVGVAVTVRNGRFSAFAGSIDGLNQHLAYGVFLQRLGVLLRLGLRCGEARLERGACCIAVVPGALALRLSELGAHLLRVLLRLPHQRPRRGQTRHHLLALARVQRRGCESCYDLPGTHGIAVVQLHSRQPAGDRRGDDVAVVCTHLAFLIDRDLQRPTLRLGGFHPQWFRNEHRPGEDGHGDKSHAPRDRTNQATSTAVARLIHGS